MVTPFVPGGVTHVYHQYTLRVGQAAEFGSRLGACGVGSNVYYPVPVHRQAPFRDLGLAATSLPITERLVNEILSIPVHPALSDSDVDTVIQAVNDVARELGPPPSDG